MKKNTPSTSVCLYHTKGRDTFSAFPILFNRKPDIAGFWFDRNSRIFPSHDYESFNDLTVAYTAILQNADEPQDAPYPATFQIAATLSWQRSKQGLWVSAGFMEDPDLEEDETSVVKEIQTLLRTKIRQGKIALTYSTVQNRCIFRDDGYVIEMPVVAFMLYEPKTL